MSESSEFSGYFGMESGDSVESQLVTENIIGTGATCTVYRVRKDGVQVALKRLKPELRLNAAFVAAYRKEFEIGIRLRHDALPVFKRFRADQHEVYIIEDFIDGVNLKDFLSAEDGKKYFRKEENVNIFLNQLLDVVTYLHRSGVIHCDLKPENIMLRHSDRAVMLIDLDKAYCDTHNLTHGGTRGMSDPLPPTDKPTASKDFAAIGRIAELICGGEKQTSRKYRRFCNFCAKSGITADELRRVLQSSRQILRTFTEIAISCVGVILLLTLVFFRNGKMQVSESGKELKATSIDAEANILGTDESYAYESERFVGYPTMTESEKLSTIKLKSTYPTEMSHDFDIRMAEYIKAAEEALTYLRSGNISEEGLQQIATKLESLWSSSYNGMLDDYRKHCPDASEAEIYQAVITASGSSKAFRVMNAYTKELLDTIRTRSEIAGL